MFSLHSCRLATSITFSGVYLSALLPGRIRSSALLIIHPSIHLSRIHLRGEERKEWVFQEWTSTQLVQVADGCTSSTLAFDCRVLALKFFWKEKQKRGMSSLVCVLSSLFLSSLCTSYTQKQSLTLWSFVSDGKLTAWLLLEKKRKWEGSKKRKVKVSVVYELCSANSRSRTDFV